MRTRSHLGIFVALLRAVNVGGNNMISMKLLKESFENSGFTNVATYINSGNIIFTSKETDARKLERKVEQLLLKGHELDSKVVVRSLPEMAKLVESLPRTWDDDSRWRYYVMFLRHTVDSDKILDDLPINADMEEVVYRPGTLLWSAQLTDLSRSKMAKLVSRKIYHEMTVRNLNTTKKLYELMKKLDKSEK